MLYDDRDRRAVRDAVVATTVLAWLVTIGTFASGPSRTQAHVHMPTTDVGFTAAVSVVNWLLMLAAMMTPVLLEPIQFVRGQGLARRRAASTIMFLAGYAAIWMVAGAMLRSIAATIDASGLTGIVGATVMLAGILAWQCSPAKQICLNRCHVRPPLAAFGPRATRDLLRFGVTHGVWCVGSCWTWMLAPLLFPSQHTAVMMAATLLVFCERLEKPASRSWRWRGLGTASRIVTERMRIHRHTRAAI